MHLECYVHPILDRVAPVMAAQTGARRASQERVSGERSERTLDAPCALPQNAQPERRCALVVLRPVPGGHIHIRDRARQRA